MEKDDLRGLPKEKKTCFVLCIECYWGVFISFLDVSLRLFPFVYPPQGSVPYWRDPAWPPEEEFRRRAGHETNEPNSPHPSLKRVRIGNQTAPPEEHFIIKNTTGGLENLLHAVFWKYIYIIELHQTWGTLENLWASLQGNYSWSIGSVYKWLRLCSVFVFFPSSSFFFALTIITQLKSVGFFVLFSFFYYSGSVCMHACFSNSEPLETGWLGAGGSM